MISKKDDEFLFQWIFPDGGIVYMSDNSSKKVRDIHS